MSIKEFVKEHCPESLLPILRMPYRIARWPVRHARLHSIRKKALKYMPYYQDELSREILSCRLEYLKTGDRNIFLDLAEKTGMKFHNLPYTITDNYSGLVLLYDNKGSNFRYVQRLLSSHDFSMKYRLMTLKEFLDGAEVHDSELLLPVLTSEGAFKFKQASLYRKVNVFADLFYTILDAFQYFDVFSPVDDEIVVDAGAYDGGTAIQFLEWGKRKVKHVYSFEFDPKNAAKCEENLRPYADKVTLIKKGTWDKDEVMYVNGLGGSGSSVGAAGDTEVYLTAIDNVVKDERVTFIKMDVEGAELKSLMGARETIIKNHPRLAICVYHKHEDLYEIPGYILSLVPEYKFLLRHYSSREYETVLYAYCD